MTAQHYDYFVIGAGSGGVRSARIAASHGVKVGIAERDRLGGTCVNIGCVPKKLFAYGADYGSSRADMAGYGWEGMEQTSFNWHTLRTNKNTEIARLNGIYQNLLENSGVDLFRGTARFIDPHTIDINGQRVTADKILIAVGGRPRRPVFDGAEHASISDDIFEMEEFPSSVVIQGGGYIAVEFAHIFHGLGAHVTLLYRGDLWLRGFDDELRHFLFDEYQKQGIDVRFQSDISCIEASDKGYLVTTTDDKTLKTDLVLSAIGREPYTAPLGLDEAKVTTDPTGRIPVNKNWQTSQSHIYAVGDVSNAHNLTPYAIAEGHILADRLFGGPDYKTRDTNLDLIPTAVFSSPNMGTVGLTEQQAIQQGYDIDTYKTDFKPMRHTLSGGNTRTFMKLIVCAKTHTVLGCHMCGEDTPEMLQGIAIAMNAGATKMDFDRTIGIHPTAAEELVTMRSPIHK